MTLADQIFILLLALEALMVAVGLMKKKNMWPFIVAYWVTLLVKNGVNFLSVIQ